LGARVLRALETEAPLIVPFSADCRDFLSPKVYADLIMQIATKDSVGHEVVNVGSGNPLSVEEAVRRLLKSTNVRDLIIEFDSRSSATPRLVADNLRLREILGQDAYELDFP
jgi:nucleoside-diphosphate-sugar epimerase